MGKLQIPVGKVMSWQEVGSNLDVSKWIFPLKSIAAEFENNISVSCLILCVYGTDLPLICIKAFPLETGGATSLEKPQMQDLYCKILSGRASLRGTTKGDKNLNE